MSLCKYLENIYFINLDKRTDRLAEITQEIDKLKLTEKTKRFKAYYHAIGIVGCTKSHLELLKLAQENNLPYVLILEDDFEFLVTQNELLDNLAELEKYENQNNFDVCFLSYNIQQSQPITDYPKLLKITESQTASGYLVKQHYYPKLINLYEENLPNLILTGKHWEYANDQCWKSLQKVDHWIGFATRLGKQRPSYSDNSQSFVDLKC